MSFPYKRLLKESSSMVFLACFSPVIEFVLFEGGPDVAGVCGWFYECHHFSVDFHECLVFHRSSV